MSGEIDARFLTQLQAQIPHGSQGSDEGMIRDAVETALEKANILDTAEQARCRDAVLGAAESAGWKLDGLASSLGLQATLASLVSKYPGPGAETDLAGRMAAAFGGGVQYELPDKPLGLKMIPSIPVVLGQEPAVFDFGEPPEIKYVMTHMEDIPRPPTERRDPHFDSTHESWPRDYAPAAFKEPGYPAMGFGISFPDGNKAIDPADLPTLLAADATFEGDYQADTIHRLGLPQIEQVMDLATGFRELAGKRRIETRDLVAFAETVGAVFGTTLDQKGMGDLKTRLQHTTDDIGGYQALVLSYLGGPESRDLGQRGPFMMRSLKQSLLAFAPPTVDRTQG